MANSLTISPRNSGGLTVANNLRAIISGTLSITAFPDPESRHKMGMPGTVDIHFRNYPLDPDHVSMMNDTLLQLIERAVEPPDGKTS